MSTKCERRRLATRVAMEWVKVEKGSGKRGREEDSFKGRLSACAYCQPCGRTKTTTHQRRRHCYYSPMAHPQPQTRTHTTHTPSIATHMHTHTRTHIHTHAPCCPHMPKSRQQNVLLVAEKRLLVRGYSGTKCVVVEIKISL